MLQQPSVSEVTKKIQRYWYEDGIWEIGFGLINAVWGLFFLMTAPYDWHGPRALLLMLLQLAIMIGPFLVINRVVIFLKERITYPRTGYVAYRRPSSSSRLKRFMLGGMIGMGVAAMVGVLAAIQAARNSVPLFVGLIMAAMLVYLGYRFALLRLYLVAALTGLWGFVVSQLPLQDLSSTGAYFSGFGGLMMLSGSITLLLYLFHTRPTRDETSEEPFNDD